jgi:hypothetical protein
MVSAIELRYDMDDVPNKAEGAILSWEPPFYLHQATSPANEILLMTRIITIR